MNKYEQGNLALQAGLAPERYPSSVPGPQVYPDYESERRKRLRRLRQLQYENNVYTSYKQSTRIRTRHMLSLLLVILIAAAALGVSVFRYARITELNFSNVRLNRQIKELKVETSLIKNAIISKMNLDEIRRNAREEAGLQEANPQQIIQLDFSATDTIVYLSETTSKMEYDFAVATIEDWVKDQCQLQP